MKTYENLVSFQKREDGDTVIGFDKDAKSIRVPVLNDLFWVRYKGEDVRAVTFHPEFGGNEEIGMISPHKMDECWKVYMRFIDDLRATLSETE